jgi:hypothetical protein
MRLIRTAAMAAIAKRIYDEARKPENQRKIKQLIDSARERGRRSR